MVDYNANTQTNHKHVLDILFFYGFKQKRFKLQCGFGGFQLPPMAEKSKVYKQCQYEYAKQLEQRKVERDKVSKHMRQMQMKKDLKKSADLNGHCIVDKEMKKSKKSKKRKWKQRRENKLQQCDEIDICLLNDQELRHLNIPFAHPLASSTGHLQQ